MAETVSSPSHPVMVRKPAGEPVEVSLADGGAAPDRDFVLRWKEPRENALTPRAWRYDDGEESYALVQLRAPRIDRRADGFQQDVYFLVDNSGSMQGVKWTKTCEALHAFVELLGEQDRAWITFFETTHRDYAERPLPARTLAAQRAFRDIESIGAHGGTEMLPAMGTWSARSRSIRADGGRYC